MLILTKQQALELLPAVVDHEATEDEVLSFLSYIENDKNVKNQYESALRIKNLLSQKYPKAKAPDHLKSRIWASIQQTEKSETRHSGQDRPAVGIIAPDPAPVSSAPFFKFNSLIRYLSAAALILFITLLTIHLLERTSGFKTVSLYFVETYAAEHFLNSNGSLIEPSFSSRSIAGAQQFIKDEFDMDITIPEIAGAQFRGVVSTHFFKDLKTPLLEYEQEDIGEIIYIFAFRVHDIETVRSLQRHDEAVKTCVLRNDYFVLDVEGTHVVTWLWDDYWYTAISNHNGYDLASLVKPLNLSN